MPWKTDAGGVSMSTCLDTPLHSSMGSWDRALLGGTKPYNPPSAVERERVPYLAEELLNQRANYIG